MQTPAAARRTQHLHAEFIRNDVARITIGSPRQSAARNYALQSLGRTGNMERVGVPELSASRLDR